MRLPHFIKDAVNQESALASFMTYTLSQVEDHVSSSRLEFFPNYTDHGVSHIEETIQTAVDLITEDAANALTSVDRMLISIAVSLHDLGMHLTRYGFHSLIARDSVWKPIPFFDITPWHDLWSDFFSEARRFSGLQLQALFGHQRLPDRLPSPNEDWSDTHRLLVGEFLRRHHHRLAHEIALYGLPARDASSVPICLQQTPDQRFWADVCGLTARSHGMSLRPCLDYLEAQYSNKVTPRRANAAFVMVLVRLSDYFQLQSTRAPHSRTTVEKFRSSISSVEWKVHQSVRDIHTFGADPEAIMITAEPPDVESYLRLRAWLTGIQRELDDSWAILGEVYGRQKNSILSSNGMQLRRVRSNIDDHVTFASTVGYIPEKVQFDTAGTELLRLLIGPLYGYNASVGFRELIQNAVDAVRERRDITSDRHTDIDDAYVQDHDVHLHISIGEHGYPEHVTIPTKE